MRPTRRFHVGDLLAVVMGDARASRRGLRGAIALVRYVTRYRAFAFDDEGGWADAARAAVLAAHPGLGTYGAADVPPPELLAAWRRRRAREFGAYLPAPQLPLAHPLLAGPAATWMHVSDEDEGLVEATAQRQADQAAQAALAVDAPADAPVAGRPVARLRRRFHIGDLLALTTEHEGASRRGARGPLALVWYMADRAGGRVDGGSPGTDNMLDTYGAACRAAVLTAYPELGAYTAADVPPAELLDVWLGRREREFGCYLPAPRLPAAHPLCTPAPPNGAPVGGAPGTASPARST